MSRQLQPEQVKNKLQPLLNRNYESMELLAPMEIRLKLQNARVAVGQRLMNSSTKLNKSTSMDVMCQVKRDPKDPDRSVEMDIPDIFAGDSKLTCLSKYKMCESKGYRIQPKLVICICAYNEGKGMLKESLNGVYDSLARFKKEAGIHPEQIVVTVIFDGIENVKRGDFDEDIITMFDEYDFRNGSILKEGEKTFYEVLEKEGPDGIGRIDWKKVSTYKPEEIAERTSNRFRTRYDEYKRYKQLEKICLDSNHPVDVNKVPEEVRNEYNRLKNAVIKDQLEYAVQKFKKDHFRRHQDQAPSNEREAALIFARYEEKKKAELEDKFEFYTNQKNYMERAYSSVLELTRKYFKTRQDTTLIYPMRYVPGLIEMEHRESASEPNSEQPEGLNVLLCVKHQNAGKLSSHALFFLGFCHLMQPELCLLLDIGLKPLGNAIFDMYKYMDLNTNTGGTCGYMGVQIERAGDEFGNEDKDHIDSVSNFLHHSLFSIQRAQMFEYHFGHLVDKPFEAAFNFIHVLPGAFSCYRYSCLQGPKLLEYLSPALDRTKERSLQQQNRYLAEDRTLSLVLKAQNFDFAYIPSAKAVVDPASDLSTMMGQRRRWINGSWFSFFHVFSERHQIQGHCATHFQFWYYMMVQGISYVSIGLFFAALYVSMDSILSQYITQDLGSLSVTNLRNATLAIVMFLYIFSLGAIFFLSLQVKNNDKRFQTIYYSVSTFLGLYGCLVMGLMVVNLIELVQTDFGRNTPPNQGFYNLPAPPPIPLIIGAMMVATFAIYIVHVIFSFNLRIIWEVLVSTPSYLFYAPTYLHILVIYAFCKIDDFSWGTKGLEKSSSTKEFLQEQNRIKKYKHVSKFLLWNTLVAVVLTIFIVNNNAKEGGVTGRTIYMLAFSGFLLLITVFKFLVSIGYLTKFYLSGCCNRYSEGVKIRNSETGRVINDQVNTRLSQLKDKYVSQTTELLKGIYNISLSKIRLSRTDLRST